MGMAGLWFEARPTPPDGLVLLICLVDDGISVCVPFLCCVSKVLKAWLTVGSCIFDAL